MLKKARKLSKISSCSYIAKILPEMAEEDTTHRRRLPTRNTEKCAHLDYKKRLKGCYFHNTISAVAVHTYGYNILQLFALTSMRQAM